MLDSSMQGSNASATALKLLAKQNSEMFTASKKSAIQHNPSENQIMRSTGSEDYKGTTEQIAAGLVMIYAKEGVTPKQKNQKLKSSWNIIDKSRAAAVAHKSKSSE